MDVLEAIWRRRGVAPGPRVGSDDTVRATARLIATDDPNYTSTVALFGSDPIVGVPTVPSTYTGVTSVHVLVRGGRPVQVLGPASNTLLEELGATPDESLRVVTGRQVSPSWSGTYRVDRGEWDRWNTSSYGGRSDVYQAGSSSSGTLYGLATYGDQIVSLGASEITRARLTLVASGSASSNDSWTATVQGCVSGEKPAGAPSFSGSTFTGSVAGYGDEGQVTYIDVPATVREEMRTGLVKSLGLVGGTYGGTYGTGNAPGWSLDFDYEVTD